MKKSLIIIGFITALTSVILAVTPLSNLAIFPIVIAFLSGLGILWFSKKQQSKTKSIQYIFLLTIIALSLTIYKGVMSTNDLGDVEALEQKEEETLEDSIDQLEGIEIDDDT